MVLARAPRLLQGPAPFLVLVVAAAVAGALRGGLTDLFVYRYGGRAVLHGLPIYASDDPVTGLSVTYPPFAAIVMVPLTVLPSWLAAALWTGASVGALAGVVAVVRRALDRPAPGWLIALVTGGALALEPVWQNLTFGQVNLFLMLAVLVDLVLPERRWSGVLVGIAAGVKLTPLVFIVLLVLVGRRAAAGRAAVAFAGTVAVGFAVTPASAATYWTDGLVDAGRVGPPALAHNQSAYGALTRILDGPPPTLLWLTVGGLLSLVALVVGAVWWRRGDPVLGTCLGAVAMLVASPVSWSHHWVWAVPVALALWERNRWAAATWVAVFVARPVVWPPYGRAREYAWSAPEHVLGNAYLLAALALLSWATATLPNQRGPEHPEPMGGTTAQKSMAVPLAAFAAGAVVALVVGVFGTVHDPTLDGTTTLGFRTVIEMKVVVSSIIGVLAVLQVVGAVWIYGRLGIAPPSWLGTAHRITGTVVLLLATFVAYHCLWALGLESGTLETGEKVPMRTVVHGVLGCAVVGAAVVKVVAVRSKRAPGWFLPVAGGLLFALLVVVVLTSAVWYVDAKGWPASGGYG